MIEILGVGIAVMFAGYLMYPRDPSPLSQSDLPRYRRMSEEARRMEIHPFEEWPEQRSAVERGR